MVLCAFTGMLLLPSADPVQRLLGAFLLLCGAGAGPIARRRIARGVPLQPFAPTAEWWSGFLLVLGATTLGADDPVWRAAGSILWAAAGLLPLLSRYYSLRIGNEGRIRADAPAYAAEVGSETTGEEADGLPTTKGLGFAGRRGDSLSA
jgi:hypothetical protein